MSLLTSEALAQVGARGRDGYPGADGGPKGSGGVGVSMVLTSTPRRRRTPRRNRSIPTISAGRVDVGLVNVSAVDTGLPAGGLGGRAERSHPDAGFTFPSQTSSDSRPGGRWRRRTPAPARTRPGRSTPRGSGSTGRGLCVLHEGPTYLDAPTLLQWIPTLVQYRPGTIPAAASSRTSPASTASNDHQARRAGVVRCHGPEALGDHETTQRPAGPVTVLQALRTQVGVVEAECSTTPTARQSGEPALSSGAPAARSGPTPWRPRPGAEPRWRPRYRWEAWCRPRRPR